MQSRLQSILNKIELAGYGIHRDYAPARELIFYSYLEVESDCAISDCGQWGS